MVGVKTRYAVDFTATSGPRELLACVSTICFLRQPNGNAYMSDVGKEQYGDFGQDQLPSQGHITGTMKEDYRV